jgi:antitoxin component of MazEF toxin-antitoxin module
MLKGRGTVWKASGNARSHVIYIPADLVKDSAYPFQLKESVNVEIRDGKIIVSKERS